MDKLQKCLRYSSRVTDGALCLLSAGMLILAFPKTDLSFFAWIGLIPLLFVLDGKKPGAAFRSAYLCGFIFFAGVFFWFFHLAKWFGAVAVFGIVLLFLYLALYFGIFGLSYSLFSRQKPLFKLFLLPSVWVVLEFIRAHLFTGFDWAGLGYSQYKNLPIIQIADITGVFGISFIIVMVNVLLKEWITAIFIKKTSQTQKTSSVLMWITATMIVSVLVYGTFRLSSSKEQSPSDSYLSVAFIQANIPQEEKWQKSAWPTIMAKYMELTEQASAHHPDLIIWPETSYPGYLWDDQGLFTELKEFVRRIKIPLLFGSVTKEGEDYYNTAILLSQNADVVETYRKIHLVPFGEFLPLRSVFPFLSDLLGIGDFTAGNEWTVFRSSAQSEKDANGGLFSVLICFEDTVARLSRQFVRRGAQFLVNVTNDAWFGDTKAPFMHVQSSVFRTVENRRSMVRAANTGVSCFIDRWGRMLNCVEGSDGFPKKKTYVSGYQIAKMDFNSQLTFYTKFGDVFTIFCFGCILWGIKKRKNYE